AASLRGGRSVAAPTSPGALNPPSRRCVASRRRRRASPSPPICCWTAPSRCSTTPSNLNSLVAPSSVRLARPPEEPSDEYLQLAGRPAAGSRRWPAQGRSEEHTSELQSRENLVCRLLLEKKKLE